LDFQVNDQTYFVNLGEDPGEWQVFVSTPSGARAIPVYVDEGDLDLEETPILIEDRRRRKIVN
jgi:hypothetical protein